MSSCASRKRGSATVTASDPSSDRTGRPSIDSTTSPARTALRAHAGASMTSSPRSLPVPRYVASSLPTGTMRRPAMSSAAPFDAPSRIAALIISSRVPRSRKRAELYGTFDGVPAHDECATPARKIRRACGAKLHIMKAAVRVDTEIDIVTGMEAGNLALKTTNARITDEVIAGIVVTDAQIDAIDLGNSVPL